MREVVLISGGSGLVGGKLTELLLADNYEVWHLSRHAENNEDTIPVVQWDIEKFSIAEFEAEKVDHIVHLAGAGIADKRWTEKRKKIILDSRIKSAELLFETLKNKNHQLKTFITASGINYYGTQTTDHTFTEDDPPADDFLGRVCNDWESVADRFSTWNARIVKIRTALVMAEHDSALQQMELPVKLGLGSPLGSGKQYLPWIHIDDLCRIYMESIKNNNWKGAFNAAAPHHISNREFMKKVAGTLDKPFFMPPVPSFLLKLIFGEMSNIILKGSRISSKKLAGQGFEFHYENLDQALENIYGK